MAITLHNSIWSVAIVSLVALSAFAQPEKSPAGNPFPSASPAECGLQDRAIALLSDFVNQQIEHDEAVGAELHIIKDGKTVLHQAFGYADKAQERQLETNSVYCVRSMTKPLVGTAIQMLVDEGRLGLDQAVSSILPEFDRPDKREITIRQLMTHTSGLPFSTIGKPLSNYSSLDEIVAEAASVPLVFPPGTAFQYSDAGSDTLGAVIARITGSAVENFLHERLLHPLEMGDTYTLLPQATATAEQKDLLQRIPSAYSGGTGLWQRHWQPGDDRIFPIFLTSQSLYTTTSDYAKFLQLWLADGEVNGRRLLTEAAIERGLAAGRKLEGHPVRSDDVTLTYGQQWMVYHDNSMHLTSFGHNGSDGTYAWVWPDNELVVLFFTQSRGTSVGIALEKALHQLLVLQDIDGFEAEQIAKARAKQLFRRYEGIYWDQDNPMAYYEVHVEGNELFVERPGRLRAAAKPAGEEGKFRWAGQVALEFEDGDPSPAILMNSGKSIERQPRHVPPEADNDLQAMLSNFRDAHGMSNLCDSGTIKLSGSITMGPLRMKSKIAQWFDQRNLRTEINGWLSKSTVIINGEQVAISTGGSLERQEGIIRKQEALGHPAIQFGDLSRGYQELSVLKTFDYEGNKLVAIRAYSRELPAQTLFLDASTGLITASHSLQFLPGAGFVGMETQYRDYRDVAGMKLPFQIESEFATPMIGKVSVQYAQAEVGVASDDLFQLPD